MTAQEMHDWERIQAAKRRREVRESLGAPNPANEWMNRVLADNPKLSKKDVELMAQSLGL